MGSREDYGVVGGHCGLRTHYEVAGGVASVAHLDKQ